MLLRPKSYPCKLSTYQKVLSFMLPVGLRIAKTFIDVHPGTTEKLRPRSISAPPRVNTRSKQSANQKVTKVATEADEVNSPKRYFSAVAEVFIELACEFQTYAKLHKALDDAKEVNAICKNLVNDTRIRLEEAKYMHRHLDSWCLVVNFKFKTIQPHCGIRVLENILNISFQAVRSLFPTFLKSICLEHLSLVMDSLGLSLPCLILVFHGCTHRIQIWNCHLKRFEIDGFTALKIIMHGHLPVLLLTKTQDGVETPRLLSIEECYGRFSLVAMIEEYAEEGNFTIASYCRKIFRSNRAMHCSTRFCISSTNGYGKTWTFRKLSNYIMKNITPEKVFHRVVFDPVLLLCAEVQPANSEPNIQQDRMRRQGDAPILGLSNGCLPLLHLSRDSRSTPTTIQRDDAAFDIIQSTTATSDHHPLVHRVINFGHSRMPHDTYYLHGGDIDNRRSTYAGTEVYCVHDAHALHSTTSTQECAELKASSSYATVNSNDMFENHCISIDQEPILYDAMHSHQTFAVGSADNQGLHQVPLTSYYNIVMVPLRGTTAACTNTFETEKDVCGFADEVQMCFPVVNTSGTCAKMKSKDIWLSQCSQSRSSHTDSRHRNLWSCENYAPSSIAESFYYDSNVDTRAARSTLLSSADDPAGTSMILPPGAFGSQPQNDYMPQYAWAHSNHIPTTTDAANVHEFPMYQTTNSIDCLQGPLTSYHLMRISGFDLTVATTLVDFSASALTNSRWNENVVSSGTLLDQTRHHHSI
jgi:hypothetical protein